MPPDSLMPRTLAEKLQVAAHQALSSEAEAYATLEYILRDRPWPMWLQEVAASIDGPNATKYTQGDCP